MSAQVFNHRSFVAAVRALTVVVAILPFQLLYVQHYVHNGRAATGFVQYDMPYYVANGREIFERGNGVAHPNPFDPDRDAPVIYFHWLTWLLGLGITQFGVDPGLLMVALGVTAGLACSWLTLRLVEALLPESAYRLPLFLLAMWGGGFFSIAAASMNVAAGRPLLDDLLRADPGLGWWFLNWGRNLCYPTEAVYHAIVAGIWLAAVKERWQWSLFGVALLAATHPFSGVQHLAIMFAWLSLEAVRWRTPAALRRWLVVSGLLAIFAAYYFVYLESFPQHRRLRLIWSQSWTVSIASLGLAYAPLMLVALYRLRQNAARADRAVQFFLICFAVTLLLIKHDWFVAPRQPAHFTRGYAWMPLCLLALPQLQSWLIGLRTRQPRAAWCLAATLVVVASIDNATFLSQRWCKADGDEREQLYLSPDQRDALAWINEQKWTGVLLSPDLDLSYLAGVYTSVRPYFGHVFCTPHITQRKADVHAWLTEPNEQPWMDEVDYVLLQRRGQKPAAFRPARWRVAYENQKYRVYTRKAASEAVLPAKRPSEKRSIVTSTSSPSAD